MHACAYLTLETGNWYIFKINQYLTNYRYLEAGQGVTQAQLNISMNECGTELFEEEMTDNDEVKTGYYNTIIVQMDPEVQEVWDTARKINCEWVQYVEKQERSCF